ncbi:PhzF family phenazine biosynthesis protein [Paraburkholderia phymatum]|uniref:Phenazine biosynthesis protein PhzF family n=1 Tax=Paraburkholderia phymatum (strain DSM 17167 / CIP 108236 / LMG 21445 / STM815) TaxID=391038 RepID=B2JE88_PARP8|nr:PhzF family phenazine biosynthesis protein [Paraburkholderia phymatum]ACC71296.1 phenazine biosynthesis protein PhzF family [Paraburkholderia phymatum STM815]
MQGKTVRFKQVDVFTSVPFKGNPLALIFDADALDTEQMQAIAHWTNLSETAFMLKPTDPSADYRVRIFTTHGELPFAGHPTLGTAHAWREAGNRPKQPGRLVQQCAAGLIELEQDDSRAGVWSFAAPPARVTPLAETEYAALALALHSDAIDYTAQPCGVDNGPQWLVVRMKSAAACLALDPDSAALARVVQTVGARGLAAYGPHDANGPANYELRCLMLGGGLGIGEDPVTGSANAALANLLTMQNARPGMQYTVRQGTALGRAGDVYVRYDDAADKTWIGGASLTVVDGAFRLP